MSFGLAFELLGKGRELKLCPVIGSNYSGSVSWLRSECYWRKREYFSAVELPEETPWMLWLLSCHKEISAFCHKFCYVKQQPILCLLIPNAYSLKLNHISIRYLYIVFWAFGIHSYLAQFPSYPYLVAVPK